MILFNGCKKCQQCEKLTYDFTTNQTIIEPYENCENIDLNNSNFYEADTIKNLLGGHSFRNCTKFN